MKIAVNHLYLPDGKILHQEVLQIENGAVVQHWPLTEEQPFTIWKKGSYRISSAGRLEKYKHTSVE